MQENLSLLVITTHSYIITKPMTFDSSWHKNYIFIRAGQMASGEDLLDTLETLSKDPRFDDSLDQVWDFTDTKEFRLSTNDLMRFNKISEDDCFVKETTCLALVAHHPSVYFRLQAIVSYTRAHGCNSKVFSHKEDAHAWIDREYLKNLSLN